MGSVMHVQYRPIQTQPQMAACRCTCVRNTWTSHTSSAIPALSYNRAPWIHDHGMSPGCTGCPRMCANLCSSDDPALCINCSCLEQCAPVRCTCSHSKSGWKSKDLRAAPTQRECYFRKSHVVARQQHAELERRTGAFCGTSPEFVLCHQ